MQKRYFFAKLGPANYLAEDYLKGANPSGAPGIPIFFNGEPSTKEDFLVRGGAREQGRNIFWAGEHPDFARIVVIHSGVVYILEPTGEVTFWWEDPTEPGADGGYTKILPVRELRAINVADVPGVVGSMSANTYYYTGTFREIGDDGNRRAIQALLQEPISPIDPNQPSDLLLCLGSIEFETLVAKLFEEVGCHVPAYRGGALKDADILARNRTSVPIHLGDNTVLPGKSISIQVKRTTWIEEPPPGCDVLITATKDAKFIIDSLAKLDMTKRWLRESLNWLPEETLTHFLARN